MKHDLLRLLLAAADDLGCEFDYGEIARWPAGAVPLFETMGLLRAASGGLFAPCPNCDGGHIEPVIRSTTTDLTRFFITCPEDLRVEVNAEMCRGWEIHPDGLAKLIADALDLTSSPKVIVPDRLWRLGRIPWKGKSRAVVLARRMRDSDATSIAAHVGAGGRALVLVPHLLPDERIWPGHVPAVVALSNIVSVVDSHLSIDGIALMEAVDEADVMAESRSILPVDPEIKKQVVRQQVKAEIKGHLEDDFLVAAYLKHGSGDKAAEALTKQLGRAVSRDRVYRAVKRARVAGEFEVPEDSPSIARTVASQPRDRAKKVSEYRN